MLPTIESKKQTKIIESSEGYVEFILVFQLFSRFKFIRNKKLGGNGPLGSRIIMILGTSGFVGIGESQFLILAAKDSVCYTCSVVVSCL